MDRCDDVEQPPPCPPLPTAEETRQAMAALGYPDEELEEIDEDECGAFGGV